jgi:hypothetical protein
MDGLFKKGIELDHGKCIVSKSQCGHFSKYIHDP